MSILRLAVPSPLRRTFDYLPPEGADPAHLASLPAGTRMKVPFGRREVTAYLLSVDESSEIAQSALKPVLEILDGAALLDPLMLALGDWAASYYHHPPGEVFAALFPKRLRDGKPHAPIEEKGWRCTTRALGLPEEALGRSPRQAQALKLLRETDVTSRAALKTGGISTAVMRQLLDKGLVEECHVPMTKSEPTSSPGLSLNEEQARAVEAVSSAADDFGCFLLEGVTGSGKTEVYLQLIAPCLARGQQVLVLIPEIGLTPQTVGRFQERFDANIAVLHSGLTDAQRYRAWEEARTGHAHIVIGTRSAIFTPLQNLGLIVVDEEHDGSYKQQDGFRYAARDVAVKRAHLHQCPVVLGSATPSLESTYNAAQGRYQHLPLTQRAGGASMPTLQLLDVRKAALQAGLSEVLEQEIAEALQRQEQVLLFLNRRGYAPTLQCHDCGWIAQCTACDARLTVHRRQRRLRCHHCGHTASLVRDCPDCNSNALMTTGLGTEQTEDRLRESFGNWPIHRVDSDSMQSRDAMQMLVDTINEGDPCILLGTQMLTKGHHFPAVSLVAIIDADALLFSTDFRGEERMAQLLTQVSGRAGRTGKQGKVLVQTHYPDHPLLQSILSKPYNTQTREMLEQRQAAQLPPWGQLILFRSDCRDAKIAEDFLYDLRKKSTAQLPSGATLIGPLPSPMQRRAGKFRAQLMLRAPNRACSQHAASILVNVAEGLSKRSDLKWSIDIDPQDVY